MRLQHVTNFKKSAIYSSWQIWIICIMNYIFCWGSVVVNVFIFCLKTLVVMNQEQSARFPFLFLRFTAARWKRNVGTSIVCLSPSTLPAFLRSLLHGNLHHTKSTTSSVFTRHFRSWTKRPHRKFGSAERVAAFETRTRTTTLSQLYSPPPLPRLLRYYILMSNHLELPHYTSQRDKLKPSRSSEWRLPKINNWRRLATG